jgi:hypothetical protein
MYAPNFGMTRADRRLARSTKRRETRRERPKGEGAPVDWSLNTSGQFPNAFPAVNGNPIVEGVARTLSRGLR